MEPIATARLRIREFIDSDSEPFVSFMTDPESTKFLTFTAEQTSQEGARALLEATIASYGTEQRMLAFAVEEQTSRRFVGFCGLHPHNAETVEIMYAVMPDARRQGYGTEIAIAISHYALNTLGYQRVIAPISPAHTVSHSVARGAGFQDVGLVQHPGFTEKVRQFVLEQQ